MICISNYSRDEIDIGKINTLKINVTKNEFEIS